MLSQRWILPMTVLQKVCARYTPTKRFWCHQHSSYHWFTKFTFASTSAFTTVGLGPANSKYGFIPGLPDRIRSLAIQHDFVVIHRIWQYHSYATWRVLRGTDIPYAVYPHRMLDPWFRRTYPLKHLKKWLYWLWADYRAPRKINKSLDSGMISIMIWLAFVLIAVGQRGFWDEEQRVAKLQDKKPVLKRLADSIQWESFRPLLDQGYAQERKSNAGRKLIDRWYFLRCSFSSSFWTSA